MAPSNFESPDSTGYFCFRESVIRYVNTYALHKELVIIKTESPKYPQARKNKRDNFILK